MSERRREFDLNAAARHVAFSGSPAPFCPVTERTIPECCCRSCVDAQLRRHAPWLLTGHLEDKPRGRPA